MSSVFQIERYRGQSPRFNDLLIIAFYASVMVNDAPATTPLFHASAVKRQAAEAQGRVAETCVADHWRSHGFSVLAQRLRTQAGEIDLIVADPSTLIFVEVKSRKTFAQAAHAVLPRQQARLFRAANSVLADHDDWSRSNIRFDIALVCGGKVVHIHDAIRPY